MNRRFRLTRSEDFYQIKRDGKTFSNKFFKVILLANEKSTLRFGFITGKSIGNAVTRNRCKRLMRASVQQITGSLHTGWDVIIICRQFAAQIDFESTLTGLSEIFRRAGLIDTKHENTTE